MTTVVGGQMMFGAASSETCNLLSGKNGLQQSSSQQRTDSQHSQPRVVIGGWKEETLSTRAGLRKAGSGLKTQILSTRLEEATLDSCSKQDEETTASHSRIKRDSSGSENQLTVESDELESRIATYSTTVTPSLTQLVQPMDMESRGAAEDEHPYSNLKVGPRWREIQGEKYWDGLLDPLDPVLRGEIVRYGEFAQAAYDGFDYNKHSPHCGSSKYSMKRLLQKVGLENRGYEVSDYIYATAGKDHLVANLLRKMDFDDTDDYDADEVWDPESNWMGFVAVCTDPKEIARLGRRDIVIVWRGTVTKLEWFENLRNFLKPSGFDPRSGKRLAHVKVEAGFLQLYTASDEKSKFCKKSAREQVLAAVKRLVHQYRFHELSITLAGHSLGSSLAKICAYDLAESCLNIRLRPHEVDTVQVPDWEDPLGLAPQVAKLADEKIETQLGNIPITVYSFGGPRVGNDAFGDRLKELGVRVLRVANRNDLVTKLPGIVLNESFQFLEVYLKPVWRWLDSLPWTYSHVGVKIEVDNFNSPYLKGSTDRVKVHNLEGYLHLVEGYQGPKREFRPTITRDIALVNKACDFLKPRFYIPSHWYQEENKGLMRTSGGKWELRRRDPEDLPESHCQQ